MSSPLSEPSGKSSSPSKARPTSVKRKRPSAAGAGTGRRSVEVAATEEGEEELSEGEASASAAASSSRVPAAKKAKRLSKGGKRGKDVKSGKHGKAAVAPPRSASPLSSPPASPIHRPSSPLSRLGGADADDSDDDPLPNPRDVLFGERATKQPAAKARRSLSPSPYRETVLPVELGSTCVFKERKCYWPAKLVGFRPATSAQASDVFTVLPWDKVRTGQTRDVKTNAIMFLSDRRLAECELGDFGVDFDDIQNDAATRETTPPLPDDASLDQLDLDEQCRALRPHMQALISESYPPAQQDIDDFFGSSLSRGRDAEKEQYGELREEEVADIIVPELRRWAGLLQHHASERARQTGSPRYQALNAKARQAFVQDILVPGLIIARCIRLHDLATAPEADDEQAKREHDAQLYGVTDAIAAAELSPDLGAEFALAHLVATAPRPLSEQDTYDRARRKLELLYANDPTADLRRRFKEVRDARARLRQTAKLPPDHENDVEKAERMQGQKGFEVSWTGRIKKAVDFNENKMVGGKARVLDHGRLGKVKGVDYADKRRGT